ncbi:MAG: carboxy-S-adenosyl-L-methionine synthase CmoA [Calditrichae bacterium]|nr:carboxy-S-adenosyl-L-methionine synthase CmoA [Calditrichia bacterium]
MKDKIYKKPLDPLVKFTFNKQVADVFPDMIARSVPGYDTTIAMIGVLAEKYATDGSVCYDLGSSLGAATLAMRHHISKNVKIVAVDNSAAMVEKSQKVIDRDHSNIPVEIICEDIRNVNVLNASVVVLNYTLQFLELDARDLLIEKIYKGLNQGGILILSEKVRFQDNGTQKRITDLHLAYKKANGYSDLEIAGKRTALENVLISETIESHKARLEKCGFKSVNVWFQCLPFMSLLAEK